MPDYNAIAADNLNGLMREIAEYTRMAEEITATVDGLKDTLKRYNAGEVVRMCAVKLSPVNMWGCFADCHKEAYSPIAGDGFNTVVARSREFDTVVNAFIFYNCNAETGRYPAFYVKGV